MCCDYDDNDDDYDDDDVGGADRGWQVVKSGVRQWWLSHWFITNCRTNLQHRNNASSRRQWRHGRYLYSAST